MVAGKDGRPGSGEKVAEKEQQDPRDVSYDTPEEKVRALEQYLTKVEEKLRKAEEQRPPGTAALGESQAGDARNSGEERVNELEALLETTKKTGEAKQEKVTRLHRSIVDIYLEVRAQELGGPGTGNRKETPFEKPPPVGEGLDKEQMGLLAKDPHTVLEFLRASLRILLADRRRYEVELQKTIERSESSFLQRLQSLQKELDEANEKAQEEMQEVGRLQRRLAETARQRQEVLDSGEESLAQLREENSRLQERLRAADEETAMLNNWNSENMRHIQVQDEKLQKIPQMEAQLNSMAQKNRAEQQKIVRSQKKKMLSLEKDLDRTLKLEADNDQLKEYVQMLQRETASLRKARNEPQMERLELKTKRLEEASQRKQKENEKLQDAVKKLTLKLEKKEEDLSQMSKEYARVYEALKKQMMAKDERGGGDLGGADSAEQLGRQPYVAEVLRKKVQEREEDIQRLNVKLRHFLIIEKKMAIQQKSFQDERERYEAELSDWRIKLTNAEDRHERLQRTLSAAPSYSRSGGGLGFSAGGGLGSTEGAGGAGDTTLSPPGGEGEGMPALGESGGEALSHNHRSTRAGSLRPQSATSEGRQQGATNGRPSSSITGRRLPASQTAMGASNSMSVGELLPASRRPSSAPRARPAY